MERKKIEIEINIKIKEKLVPAAFLLGFLLLTLGIYLYQTVIPLQKDAFRPYWAEYTQLWLKEGDGIAQSYSLNGHLYTGFLLQTKTTESAEGVVAVTVRSAGTNEIIYHKTYELCDLEKEGIAAEFADGFSCEDYIFQLSVMRLEAGSGFAVLASEKEHGGLIWNGYQKDYGMVLTNHCKYRFRDFGILYLIYIVLCIVFCLFLFRKKSRTSEKLFYRIMTEAMFWAAVVCVVGGLWSYTRTEIADRAVQKTLTFDAVSGSDCDAACIRSGKSVFQTFGSPAYKMDGICFFVRETGNEPEGELAVLMTRNSDQKILYDQRVPLHTCIDGNVDIRFDAVSCEPWNEQFTVSVTYFAAEGADEKIGLVCTDEENDLAQMSVNGQVTDRNLLIKTKNSNHPYFISYFTLIFGLVTGVIIAFTACIRYRKIPFLPVFAGSAIAPGIVYSLIFLPYCVEDEWSHFGMAYDLSNSFLGIESGYGSYDWESEYFSYPVRKEDWMTFLTSNVDLDRGEYIWEQLGGRVQSEEMVQGRGFYVLTLRLPYLPAALGIALARVLGFNTFTLFYMGRFFQLLFHVFLLCISMRLCPKAKELIAAVFLIPIDTYLLMSYSYDGVTICSIILFITFFLNILNKKKTFSLWNLIVVMLLMLLIINLKGGAYFPLAFCYLLVSQSQFRDKRQYLWFQAGLTLSGLTAVLGTYTWRAGQREVLRSVRSVVMRQPAVAYYLHRLDRIPDMVINTFVHGIIDGILDLFGRRLSDWYDVPSILIILIMICFFFLAGRCSILSGKRKVLGSVTVMGFLSVVAGQAILTPVGSSFIMFAGRYLCPLLFSTGILFSGRTEKSRPEFWLLCLVLLNAAVVLTGIGMMYAGEMPHVARSI